MKKSVMVLTVLFMLCEAGVKADTVAYWKFDEGAGQIAYSENLLNDIPMRFGTSDSLWADPSWSGLGITGSCISFVNEQGASEGNRDFLLPDAGTEPNSINSLKLSTFTIEAWIKLKSVPLSTFDDNNPYTVLHLSDDFTNDLYPYLLRIIRKSDTTVQFSAVWYDSNKVVKVFTHPAEISIGVWHHIAVAHDSSSSVNNTILWVDGVEYVQNTVNHPNTNFTVTQFCIGASIVNSTTDFRNRSFDGWIDEVRISSRMLSADQLLLPYNHGGPMVNYLVGDLNKDFHVGIDDLDVVIDSWLSGSM